jgi:hypothetical protein
MSEQSEKHEPLDDVYAMMTAMSEWDAKKHAEHVHWIFKRLIGVDNETAVTNLVATGYNRASRLADAPPTASDLDRVGFNMYERNVTLKKLDRAVCFYATS